MARNTRFLPLSPSARRREFPKDEDDANLRSFAPVEPSDPARSLPEELRSPKSSEAEAAGNRRGPLAAALDLFSRAHRETRIMQSQENLQVKNAVNFPYVEGVDYAYSVRRVLRPTG